MNAARTARPGRDGEEGVTLGVDLDAAALLNRVAQDRCMIVPDSRIPVAQLLQQPGGALDVGEQEGHRPGR